MKTGETEVTHRGNTNAEDSEAVMLHEFSFLLSVGGFEYFSVWNRERVVCRTVWAVNFY